MFASDVSRRKQQMNYKDGIRVALSQNEKNCR